MRLRLETVNLTLRGYPPGEAQRVVDGLPAAIAFALDHPGQTVPGPSGAAGREIAAAIRAQGAAHARTRTGTGWAEPARGRTGVAR